MNRRRVMLLLLALASLAGWWLWLRPVRHEYVNFPPNGRGPWVAFGDSLTAGYGASPGNDYPALLGRKIGRTILNLGRTGETTEGGRQRLEEVSTLHPSVVLLCLGGNDSLNKVPLEQTLAHLGAIVERLQGQGAFVVLIGVRSASLRDKYDQPFRRLARDQRTFFISNILQGVLLKPIYMADALHPNDAGYAMIAQRLAEELAPLLQSLP